MIFFCPNANVKKPEIPKKKFLSNLKKKLKTKKLKCKEKFYRRKGFHSIREYLLRIHLNFQGNRFDVLKVTIIFQKLKRFRSNII